MTAAAPPDPIAPPRRRGRPARPEGDVRHAVLQATLAVLLAQGYEATTIEAVAAHAGVAKKTVYRHAGNRDELVGLAVREWTDGFAPQLQRDARHAEDVVPLLHGILQAVCAQALSTQAVQVFRLLTSDFPGKPTLLRTYLENGIERGRALLADWLARQQKRGLLRAGDPEGMARLLLAMAVAEPLRERALGMVAEDASMDAHLRDCLQLMEPMLRTS
ncbi:TetR/AcrR family transcriptional regulator [Stenotrophomonas sp. TEPEL]|uniref:TetR/AcrR family transcriptional regulator n=1 Tax=Stenotrophomonas sp. TEPEL TaxID=2283801 RepID=UPI001052A891|nr:TetR/AcrR family transcriptional regulator [Stenotrophomonas sp. TEPEL]TDB32716.1 TetR/AcrR family transcriptional regulator [Stenotrophomonas sp. TEPEL]